MKQQSKQITSIDIDWHYWLFHHTHYFYTKNKQKVKDDIKLFRTDVSHEENVRERERIGRIFAHDADTKLQKILLKFHYF